MTYELKPIRKPNHLHYWKQAAALGLLLSSTSCSSVSQYVKNTLSDHSKAQAIAKAEAEKSRAERTQGSKALADSQSSEQSPEEAMLAQAGTEAAAKKPVQTAAAKPAVANPTATKPAAQQPDLMSAINRGEDPFAMAETQRVAQVSAEQVAAEPSTNAAFQESAPVAADAASQPLPESPRADLPPAQGPLPTPMQPFPNAAACPPPMGTPVMGAPGCPPGMGMGAGMGAVVSRPFPVNEMIADEYVRDGGDRGLPVHYVGRDRAGLELEDTVAEYQEETGEMHVKPSTEALIYAPRFAEVRSATLPEQGLGVTKAMGHQDQTKVADFRAKVVVDENTRTDEAVGMQTRTRSSGLAGRITDHELDKAIAASNHTKLVNVYEEFRFIQEGRFDNVSSAQLQDHIHAALEWADGRRPIIVAQTESGQILQGRQAPQEYVGIEDRRTPADLQLIKVADKAFAHPGDIVTFTIRFDNVGERDLLKVRVVDNLSPRLEFIDGSVESSLDGQVDAVDNGAGAKLLTFEFDKPLKGKTGGYVSFQCKVR